MQRYSLEWCDLYLDELLDKMGSDLFPMPIKLNRFITISLDFIRESVNYFESTQEISDDIKHLMIRKKVDLMPDILESNLLVAAEPIDYYRLVNLVPYYIDNNGKENTKVKLSTIVKEGQKNIYNRDPFRKATEEYPSIYRVSNLFQIDLGETSNQYTKAILSYLKKPVFATIANQQQRILNISDTSIERILLKTADALRFTSGDPDASIVYNFDQTFGKKNK